MSVRQPGGGSGTAIGGQINDATSGSVIFANPDNTLAQDNQNFHFDNTADRLSIFSSIGADVVTNGTFTGSASGWTVPSGMAYSSNSVSKTSNGTGALTQSITLSTLREYLLTYTISNWTVGTITPTIGSSWTGTVVSSNGTYTERFNTATTGTLTFTPSNTARFTIDSISIKPLTGTSTASNLSVGGFSIEGAWSNGSPGTTRGFTYNNDGSYSWIDYRFSGVLRGATGANSSGGYSHYVSGGNDVDYYYCGSGLGSCSLYSYNYRSYFMHYGYGAFYGNGQFGGSVGAGTGAFTTPTSTFQTAGSTALQVKRITSSQSIDATATIWLSDATTASACTGTPSTTTCSSYTGSGQATCESHLPCSWYAGSSCSAFNNEYGMGSCSGTSGCSADTSACSGGDESTCIAGDDSYGGSCSWGATGDCSPFNEGTCSGTSGCSTNYTNCAGYSSTSTCNADAGCSATVNNDCSGLSDGGGDGTMCATQPECSYDSGTGACSGYYFNYCSGAGTFTSCTGSYYQCSGTYYTGNCSGTYGAACSGTVLCSSYSSSSPCAAETGCSWSSVLNLTLPDGEACTHRNYWIYNDATGGADTVIYPYSGQTVNETTSYTLAAYRDWVHLAYYKQTKDCSVYNEGACTPTGCSKNYANCTWNSGDNTCNGNASCTGIGDQSTCEATTYFSSCSGTETIRKNWYKVGS